MTIRRKIMLGLSLMAAIGMILGLIGLVSINMIVVKTDELHTLLQERANADVTEDAHFDELIDEKNLEIEGLEATLRTVIIVFIIASLPTCVFLVRLMTKSIVKPLIPLAGFLSVAGSTGDITLRPGDVETISKLSSVNDEIGQTTAACAVFVNRIREVSETLEKVADGDISAEFKILSDSDVMGLSLKKMMENLNNMFVEINSSASQVAIGSTQISDGAQMLAQGSTEQAASVEQLSASTSEIAEKTKDNARKAEQAADMTEIILRDAEKGSQQMDEMMSATKEITQASHDIGKIIKVIDDIAFQTNILALNAAVEAARAGQHGKGFAVVAEEVRNLAAKSAEAAKDTGELIANSIKKAQLGASIAGDTAESFVGIMSEISSSNKIVHEIAKSSEEQSAGIAQINIGIDQVAQVIQQNSATAEENAAASEQLSGQSDMMRSLISQFTLKNEDSLSAGQLALPRGSR